jgi:sialate O-acetylesterase
VQLANFQSPAKVPGAGDGWARLREAQVKALSIPKTGMALAIDIGEAGDIHPKNKQDVGGRLALWALRNDYGQTNLVCSGPLYKALTITGNVACVQFDHVGSGLMVGKKTGPGPAIEEQGGKLKQFAIAGADKKWFWADAEIAGLTVRVSSTNVPVPVAVRYAFAQNPAGCNLYNKDGLPASPFRTDEW